jgi:pteridine reductase
MELRGKRALVTGGAQRIGRAVALALAKEGCPIALHYSSSRAEAQATARDIRALGVECTLHPADLTRSKAVLGLAAKVLSHPLGCRILVNNASVFPKVTLAEAGPEDFDLPYAVNLRAPALLTQAIGMALARAEREGRIINIADVGGRLAWPGALPYSLSKAGLLQLTRVSAAALAPWVLVNSVSPGGMLMPEGAGKEQLRSSLKRSLLKRLGGPGEVARAVVHLAASDFMTGSELTVDGGRSLA